MPEGKFKNPGVLIHRAKELRRHASLPEKLLWSALCELKKQTGIKFRRQHPVHPYIIDFVSTHDMLAVELDGMSHDNRQIYDAKRSEYLQEKGWTIVRFHNEEVIKNVEGVMSTLLVQLAKNKSYG